VKYALIYHILLQNIHARAKLLLLLALENQEVVVIPVTVKALTNYQAGVYY
jgi:hypothetical protein